MTINTAIKSIAQQYPQIKTSEFKILRNGTNTVVSIPENKLILRVSHNVSQNSIKKNLIRVKEYSERGLIVEPADMRVAKHGEYCGTLWPMGKTSTSLDAYSGLGKALHSLHDITPDRSLPRLNLIKKTEERLNNINHIGLPKSIISFFNSQYKSLRPLHNELVNNGNSLIHADSHIGNIVYYQGQYRLIDMDDICIGPQQYDLAIVKNEADRFGKFQEYNQCIAGYGYNIDKWPLLQIALEFRELTATTWLAELWNESPEHKKELLKRIDTLTDNNDNRLWEAV